MLLQILFHADLAIVLLQLGHLLRHRKVWIPLPELADDQSSDFDGQVQGSFWRSFEALRLALHPHNIVLVDHQVFVERLKAKVVVGVQSVWPGTGGVEGLQQLKVGVLPL